MTEHNGPRSTCCPDLHKEDCVSALFHEKQSCCPILIGEDAKERESAKEANLLAAPV